MKRTLDTVRLLVENATRYARVYVAISDALIRQGVPVADARTAAQSVAMQAALMPELPIEDLREEWDK